MPDKKLEDIFAPGDSKPAQPSSLADVFAPTGPKDPGYLETGLKSYVRGSAGLASGAGAAAEWAGDVTGYQGLRQIGRGLQEAGRVAAESPMGRLEGPSFEGTFVENPSLKRAFGIGVEAVPSLVTAVAGGGGTASLAARAGLAAKTAAKVGSGIAAGGLGLVEGAPQYKEAREAGKGIGTASVIGAAATIGSAALEYLGLGKIFGLAGKGVARGAVSGALTEGLQEGTQQLWQNVVAKVGYDQGRSLVDGMVESIIGGAGAGGFVGGFSGAAQTKTDNVQAESMRGLFPGADVVVNEGRVAVSDPETGQRLSARVEDVAQALAAGMQPDELYAAFQEVQTGVEAVMQPEVEPKEPLFQPELTPPTIVPGVLPEQVSTAPAVAPAREAGVLPDEVVALPGTTQAPTPKADTVTLYGGEALEEGMRVTNKKSAGMNAVSEERTFTKVLDFGSTPMLEDVALRDSVDFQSIEDTIGVERGFIADALVASDNTLDNYMGKKGKARLPILMRSATMRSLLVEQGYDAVKTKEDTQASGDFKDAYFVLQEEAPAVTEAPPAGLQRDKKFKQWFLGSKVADATGAPVVVYHGTTSGGFREFRRPGKGSRRNAIHFTADRKQAETYTPYKGAIELPRGEDILADAEGFGLTVERDGGNFKVYRDSGELLTSGTEKEVTEFLDTGEGIELNGVYEVVLSMKKPYVVDWGGGNWNEPPPGMEQFGSTDGVTKYAKKEGYDGVVFNNIVDHGKFGGYYTPATEYAVFDPAQIKNTRIAGGTGMAQAPEVAERMRQYPTVEPATREEQIEQGTRELRDMREVLTAKQDSIQRAIDLGIRDREAGERDLAQNQVLLDAVELALRERPGIQEFAREVRKQPMPKPTATTWQKPPWMPEYSRITSEPEQAYQAVSQQQLAGVEKVKAAAKQLANPKSKFHDFYVQHAPKWMSVSPLHTLVQGFQKDIPQIRKFADNLATLEAAQNQLVDNSVVQYEKVEKLAKKGKRLDQFNRAAALASYYQVTPWESLRNQDWVPEVSAAAAQLKNAQKEWVAAGMQKATGKTFQEAHTEAKQAYDRMPEVLQTEYRNTVQMLSDLRQRERDNLLAYIEEMTEEGSTERANLMMHFDATFNNLRGAYWPLQRNGDFVLSYVEADGRPRVQHFDSIAERTAAKNSAIENGVDPQTISESFKDKQPRGAIAAPQVLMDQLTAVVQNKYMEGVDPADEAAVRSATEAAQDVINSMSQTWMRWQPETSALKNSIQRKSVRGFSGNMLRSFLDYTQRHATNIAWAEHGRQVERNIQDLADQVKARREAGGANVDIEGMLTNELRNRVHALRNTRVGPVASALGKLSTGYYMTSPSIALVQMSQLGVLTYPKLAVKYGVSRATKALARGVKGSVSKEFTREPMFADARVNQVYNNTYARVGELTKDLPRARDKNTGDRLYSEDEIQRQFDGLSEQQKKLYTLRVAMDRNLLDISAAHEAYDLAKGKDPDAWGKKVMDIAMLPMSLSELASRKATILATYELAQEEGKNFNETMNDISEVVNDTLYSYSKSNKPALMQGGAARNVLQFQWYRIMTGLRMAMLFKNSMKSFAQGGIPAGVKDAATKEFVGIMGMTGLLAGTMGLPLSQTTFAVLDLVLGDEDEPVDSKLMFTNWLRDNLGEGAGEAVATGAPALLGTDLSRRIGLGDIYGFQNDPPPGLHGKNLAAWWAASQLGPVFSVGQSWMQGYDEIMNKGNYMKGLEVATPKPIRDALKALRVGTQGVKSGSKKIVPDEDIGPDEVIMVALGFNPDEISRAQRSESSLRGLTTRISERRGRLIRDAARAVVEQGDTAEAMAAIREFNRKMPRYAVTGRDVRPAVRKILRGEFGATGRRETTVAEQFNVPVYRQ